MIRVALTGGIATGKSYVLERFRRHAIPAIDADDIVHEALRPGTPATQAVALEFGPGVLAPDGAVDRPALASQVFRDDAARLRLEAIVHPVVYRRIAEWMRGVDQPIAVACIPLLFETGRERDFDVVIATVCAPELQRERLLDRGLTPEEADRRIAAQLAAAEKARRAGIVIRADGAKADTDSQVAEIVVALRRRAAADSGV